MQILELTLYLPVDASRPSPVEYRMTASAQRDVPKGQDAPDQPHSPTAPSGGAAGHPNVSLQCHPEDWKGENKRITSRDAAQCVRNDTRSWEVGKEAEKP